MEEKIFKIFHILAYHNQYLNFVLMLHNSVRVQIAEVTDVMRDNVGRLLERGDQLDNLQDRSEGLASTSDQFRSSATRLRRNMWWQNTRAKLCIGGVVAIILLVIFSKYNCISVCMETVFSKSSDCSSGFY